MTPKPKYEKPTLITLGNLKSGQGQQACDNGSGDATVCLSGNVAGGQCDVGSSASSACYDGTQPLELCEAGSGVLN